MQNVPTQNKMICPKGNYGYQIVITDHILDNVHGSIGITEVERELERLPLFKRLHNISQLGLTNWIFPCALHTRYVHSIGVMHTAYNMAWHINKNMGGFFSDNDLQIIRLAGMLHDIGHYPLSHNIETAYKYGNRDVQFFRNTLISESLEELVGCPQFLHPTVTEKYFKAKRNKGASFIDKFSGSQGFHHEAIGQDIITHNKYIHFIIRDYFVTQLKEGKRYLNPAFVPINEKSKKKFDADEITHHLLEAIANMIIGNYEYSTSEYDYEERYTAMLQLIHSDLDADNVDYLLRDATFSGTSYGSMDVSMLMNCLSVKEVAIPSFNTTNATGNTQSKRTFYLVGIFPKGIACVEQFFQNKYLAYCQMILGKYVSILEAMILNWAMVYLPAHQIYGIANQANEGKGLKEFVTSPETKEEFIHFTDAFISEEFYKCYKDQQNYETNMLNKPCELAKTILSRLTNYMAFDVVQSEVCVGWSEKEIYDNLKKGKIYQDFLQVYNNTKDKTIGEFYEWSDAKSLFAFRFESYSMTKQIPIEKFCKEYFSPSDSQDIKALKHFYRLANGVPILEKEKYDYNIDFDPNGEVKLSNLPNLVVDDPSSAMSKLYQQQVVFLRKYKIDVYSEGSK